METMKAPEQDYRNRIGLPAVGRSGDLPDPPRCQEPRTLITQRYFRRLQGHWLTAFRFRSCSLGKSLQMMLLLPLALTKGW
jgi:hypothetical protein